MDIIITEQQGRVPVTVLAPQGNLDGSNYQELIETGQRLYAEGKRAFLIDMSQIGFMSSAGLVALHNLSRLLKGEQVSEGWDALHDIDRSEGKGFHPTLKLLSPQPKIQRVLDLSGFAEFVQVFSDLDEAIAAY
jgi:anti-anti-sigma regulatory factor